MTGRNLARFGVFEVDLDTGELRKHGIKVRLQTKPFQILKALLDNPGGVVTREELHRCLWHGETFVDFENGLNTAINRLRLALGDSAESPRYIETLARTGYRFIAPLERIEGAGAQAQPNASEAPAAILPARVSGSWKWYVVAALAAAALAGFLYARLPLPAEASARQLTFRRGQVGGARFGPDGQSIIYSAQFETDPRQIFLTSPVSPESRLLGFQNMSLVAVSRRGELALMRTGGTMNITGGVLLRAPINGGAPLEVDRDIMTADWSADGSALAVVRAVKGVNQLEYPAGEVLYRTSGWLSSMRVSPDNLSVALIDHPVRHDDAGSVKLVSESGESRALADRWSSAGGLAWHPSGREVWFAAARKGGSRSLWAATKAGRLRQVTQAPAILTLRDISPTGRVLITRDTRRLEMAGSIGGEKPERSFSWLDWSRVQELSADGSLVLFDESGEGAGDHHIAYVQRTTDRSTIRVSEGRAMGLAPDAASVLVLGPSDRSQFRLVSLRGGAPRVLSLDRLECQWARFFPDGRRLLLLASEPGKALRLYVDSIESNGARPSPITPEMMVRNVAISPNGDRVAVLSADSKFTVYPTGTGEPAIVTTSESLAPIHWSRNGDWIFVQHLRAYSELPARISRLNPKTGEIQSWKTLTPADPFGVTGVTGLTISADERSYVYSYRRILAELFLVDGWR